MVREALPLLKQASCYGNQDATYMLSVIYNYGIGTKVDEMLANSYMLECALAGHRLCAMSIGNKHRYRTLKLLANFKPPPVICVTCIVYNFFY